jgi:hypothetical protein
MALAQLASSFDVEDMWRPLSDAERPRVDRLVTKASALLRQAVPWVDARMARYRFDPTDLGGLSPDTVATAVATMVKNFVVNPDGATNMSETTGPYSQARGYALRGDKDRRGELQVTDSILAMLAPPVLIRSRLGVLGVSSAFDTEDPSLSAFDLPVLDGTNAPGLGWVGGTPW